MRSDTFGILLRRVMAKLVKDGKYFGGCAIYNSQRSNVYWPNPEYKKEQDDDNDPALLDADDRLILLDL